MKDLRLSDYRLTAENILRSQTVVRRSRIFSAVLYEKIYIHSKIRLTSAPSTSSDYRLTA
jgi:hypothetical protein